MYVKGPRKAVPFIFLNGWKESYKNILQTFYLGLPLFHMYEGKTYFPAQLHVPCRWDFWRLRRNTSRSTELWYTSRDRMQKEHLATIIAFKLHVHYTVTFFLYYAVQFYLTVYYTIWTFLLPNKSNSNPVQEWCNFSFRAVHIKAITIYL